MKKNESAKEIKEVKKETPAKKTKAKKAPKMVLQSKLPGLLKKTYTEKKLEKKLLRHIYIPSDLELVKSVFETKEDEKGNILYFVDRKKEIEKSKAGTLKKIIKQVKAQKPGIKIVSLVAVVVFIAAVGITITTFKNIVVKKIIVSSLQGIFHAETDIQKVDVQIFGSSLLIEKLEQTNKDNPVKNIFEIDRISLDFNLTDLLKGKFHAEELAVEGVALDTDRKKEGKVFPKKDKAEKEKENKLNLAMQNLSASAVDKLTQMFAAYNPEKMISDIQSELKSPALAEAIYKDVDSEVKKWQGTPEKLKNSVDSVTASVQTVMNTDWSKVTDPKKIEEAISTITKTTTEAQNLSKTVAETAEDLKADVNKVQSYAVQIEQAVKSDSVLVQNKVNEMKTLFSADGIKDVMNDGVQSMLYEYTGKYYPYVSKAMDMAVSSIGNKETTPEDEAKKQAKKEKKEADKAKKKAREERLKRSEGVDIYYKADRVPKLLIENVVASGYEYGTENLLFKGTAENITSDQNMIGKNTKIAADFKILEHPNNAKVIIDARANSNDPLVTASYNGGGYDINADAKVFNLKSKSDITAILTADENGSFSVGGILDMNVSEMTGMDFEPEMVNRIYKNSLAGIKKLTLGFEIGYKAETESFYVEIKNMDELGRQLVTPVVKAMTSELSVIADDAMNKALAMLTENTGIATDSISEFVKISDLINGEKSSLDNLTKQLEAKKKELTDQLSNKATSAAKDALKNAGVDTEKMGGASKMLKGLKF